MKMNKSIFRPEIFFELEHVECREIFDNVNFAWETVPKIAGYLAIKLINQKDVVAGEGTKIHPTAVIIGPAIIGRNCIIGPHAYLRENCLIGDNVHIGHAVEIKNSLLLDGATVAHLNYIGDSVIGRNVNISGGVILANTRLDRQPVTIRHGSKKIKTALAKLGSIIGDDSFIGANAVLNPGTVLGKGSKVYPLVSVKGVYDQDAIIKE